MLECKRYENVRTKMIEIVKEDIRVEEWIESREINVYKKMHVLWKKC